jgi:plastocyanin
MTRFRLALLTCLVLFVLGACGTGKSDQVASNSPDATSASTRPRTTAAPHDSHHPTAAPAATVHLMDNLFDPAKVEIKAGESVEWHWEGKSVHNVHGPDFTSKLQGEGTFDHTFAKAGTFDYRCDVHPEMKASVVVS